VQTARVDACSQGMFFSITRVSRGSRIVGVVLSCEHVAEELDLFATDEKDDGGGDRGGQVLALLVVGRREDILDL
jgi:hypothetical protein